MISGQRADVRLREDDVYIEIGVTEHGFPEQYVVQSKDGAYTAEWEDTPPHKTIRTPDGGTRGVQPSTHFTALVYVLPEMSRLAAAVSRIIYLPLQRAIPAGVGTNPAAHPDPSG